ncbi:MAG: sarcosine oxidase subunit gamma family protein [Rhizobiaceae bacterium]
MAKAAMALAERNNPVAGNKFANASVSIEATATTATTARINLRATQKGAKDFGKALGLELPTEPGQIAKKGSLMAVWIGPDEWLVVDDKTPIEELMPRRENANYSATDISHRNVAFTISGEGAANVLNSGSPRDLSLIEFPANTGSRTIFGKAEVVLIRTGRTSFRVECWRSFAPYVWELLIDGARDAHL